METAQCPAVGDLLRRYRIAAGLTQEQLAERAELSVRGLIYLERGARRPYLSTLRRLAEALDLAPAERAALMATAMSGAAPAQAGFAATHSAAHGLPIPPTPLIGRAHEEAALLYLLRRGDVRLVTLTGPGGVGKTRLALAVAAALTDLGPDGVYFVALAPLRDVALLPAAIAGAVGLHEAADRPLPESLIAGLREKRVLLLLDNVEHLLPAVGLVADLLAGCAGLTVLATSRAVLHLRGEYDFPVSPLALADPEHPPPFEALAGFPSVELFVRRAQAVRPEFRLTDANAAVVARLCARLDGLPLALELAASQLRMLSPQGLLDRLERRLPALTHGARDLPARQQTMRDAIAWSYDLLAPTQQALFRRLAVFSGGCTPEAAAAVCGPDTAQSAMGQEGTSDVLDDLMALAEQSMLLVRVQEDEPRLHMLETIREYALEQLALHREDEALRGRHAAYFLALAEGAEPHLSGPGQDAWLRRLEEEHDNLRIALQWARQSGDLALGLRLAGALQRFWEMHSHLSEGRGWFEALLARTMGADDGCTPAVRAKALSGAARLAWAQGDYAQAAALGESSLKLCRAAGDAPGSAAMLNLLGLVAQHQGAYGRATALFEEGLALRRDLGDARGLAASLNNLGEVARVQGDYGRATALFAESLAIFRGLGEKYALADVLVGLGMALLAQGEYAQALPVYVESLGLFQAVGSAWGVAYGLEGVAGVVCARGEPERAARLCGAAAALRDAIGAPLPPEDRADYERIVAAARAALGDDAFAAAWAAGRALSLDQAIAEAAPAPSDATAAPAPAVIPTTVAPCAPAAVTASQRPRAPVR